MHCVKLLKQRLIARDFDRQVAEFQVRIAVLNGYTALGIPVIETAGSPSGERETSAFSQLVQQSRYLPSW
jgi:hypothetical protein